MNPLSQINMPNQIYKINKAINQPIYFKGLRAQFIWYLGGGLVGLLILFAILYISGVNPFICLGLIFIGGAFFCSRVYKLSHTYGEFGMMKKMAKKKFLKPSKVIAENYFLILLKNNQHGTHR